jgi:hypothetical protein
MKKDGIVIAIEMAGKKKPDMAGETPDICKCCGRPMPVEEGEGEEESDEGLDEIAEMIANKRK